MLDPRSCRWCLPEVKLYLTTPACHASGSCDHVSTNIIQSCASAYRQRCAHSVIDEATVTWWSGMPLMKALAAMWRVPTNALTSLISLGWGAPQKLSSRLYSPAIRILQAGRTDYVLSPSRKVARITICVGAEVSGTSTS